VRIRYALTEMMIAMTGITMSSLFIFSPDVFWSFEIIRVSNVFALVFLGEKLRCVLMGETIGVLECCFAMCLCFSFELKPKQKVHP
jgi:uncharacterized membrane protein